MEKENKNRILILHRILSKSDKMMDDIVQLMMQLYSSNNSVLKTRQIEKHRNTLIEQLEKSMSEKSQTTT